MIIFSAFVPRTTDFSIILEFLRLAEKNFSKENIFIGLQKDSHPEIINLLKQYSHLKLHYDFINATTYINSDVSGFQKALELYHNLPKKETENDKYVYFGHTKGVTTGIRIFRDMIFDKIFNNRPHIEARLEDKNIGAYGYHLSPMDFNNGNSYSTCLLNWNDKLKYSVLNYFYAGTFFVCKKNLLDDFLKDIKYSFFTENLKDRYFFERDFIHFVDMLGYEPAYEEIVWNNSWTRKNPDRMDYEDILRKWRTTNNFLERYNP